MSSRRHSLLLKIRARRLGRPARRGAQGSRWDDLEDTRGARGSLQPAGAQLLVGLNTFRRGGDTEIAAKAGDRADYGKRLLGFAKVLDETLVEFDSGRVRRN